MPIAKDILNRNSLLLALLFALMPFLLFSQESQKTSLETNLKATHPKRETLDQGTRSDDSINSNRIDEAFLEDEMKAYVRFKDSTFRKNNVLHHYDFDETGHYIRHYKAYLAIKKEYQTTTNHLILNDLDKTLKRLEFSLPYGYANMKNLEKVFLDSIQEESIRAAAYIQLFRKAVSEGEITEAIHYDSIRSQLFPLYGDEYYHQQLSAAKKAFQVISSTLSLQLPEDEELWRIGNAYVELFYIAGPTGDGFVNMTLPFSYFRNLLVIYPTSVYCDSAEYIMLNYSAGMSQEGGDNSANLYYVKEYENFLDRYSQSKLKPEIYLSLIQLLFDSDPEIEGYTQRLDKAEHYVNLLFATTSDNNLIESAKAALRRIKWMRSTLVWKLSVTTQKSHYNPGEPINLEFTLKNTDTIPKEVLLFENKSLPNFYLTIRKITGDAYNYPPYVPIKLIRMEGQYDKQKKPFVINPGDTYSEQWNILATARDWPAYGPGYFMLNESGTYSITLRGPEPVSYYVNNTIEVDISE